MKMCIAIVGVFASNTVSNKKTPKGKRNKTAEPPQYQRNIKKQLHPEDERLDPENKSPGISENHLNQTIIFRFYLNLRGCALVIKKESNFVEKNKQLLRPAPNLTISKVYQFKAQLLLEELQVFSLNSTSFVPHAIGGWQVTMQ